MNLFDPASDPNGRALRGRTQDVYDQEMQDLQAGPQDAFTVMNMQANQRNAMSPMAPWLQALQEVAGGRNIKLGGGPSPLGSTQLTGRAVQPQGSLLGLRHAARK
jgi:hypothetical protein